MITATTNEPKTSTAATDYLMRYGGNSSRFFKLSPNAELHPAELLLSSILSNDLAVLVATRFSEKVVDQFLEVVYLNSMGGYVGHKLRSRPVLFAELSKHCDGALILQELDQMSIAENAAYQKFDERFVAFLKISCELNLIWLKGIVTSRTVYPETAFRLSTDFDFYLSPSKAEDLSDVLTRFHYSKIKNDPGFCNQLGVGPMEALADAFIAPSPDMVPSAVVGFERKGWPIVDVKFNFLDRGLKMIELDRFYENRQTITWGDSVFFAPDLLDQLLMQLVHLEKDRFNGWKSLIDIGLLVDRVNSQPEQWKEFLRRCRIEGVSTIAWAGLSLAQMRLGVRGLELPIAELKPKNQGWLAKTFVFTINPLFYWNTSSLPMLLLNALAANDRSRKLKTIRECIFPTRQFLCRYYLRKEQATLMELFRALLLHWLVLICPGGLVRATFGRNLWAKREMDP